MSVFLTSKVIIEIAVFFLILIDYIGNVLYSRKGNNLDISKWKLLKKILTFYFLALFILVLFDGDILMMSPWIHLSIILAFILLTWLGLMFVKGSTMNYSDLEIPFSKKVKSNIRLLLMTISIIIPSVIGLTTEKLKDFSFTGSNVIVIAINQNFSIKDISQKIRNGIEYDVLKIQKYGIDTLQSTQNIRIEFNNSAQIADSLIEARLFNNLEQFTNEIPKENFIVSRAKYGAMFDSKTFNEFSVLFIILTVVLLTLLAFYFKSFIKGFKISLLLNMFLAAMIGILLFAQKIITDYVVDSHLFHFIILFLILLIYKTYIYIPNSGRISVERKMKNHLINIIGLTIIAFPIGVYYGLLVIPIVILNLLGLVVPFFAEKTLNRLTEV